MTNLEVLAVFKIDNKESLKREKSVPTSIDIGSMNAAFLGFKIEISHSSFSYIFLYDVCNLPRG
jgi:hypothetical protein